MKKTIAIIASMLGILVIVFGAYFHLDASHADAMEFKALKQQVEYDKTERRWYSVRKRIWSLEERYGYNKAKTLSEYNDLLFEKESLELKLKGK